MSLTRYLALARKLKGRTYFPDTKIVFPKLSLPRALSNPYPKSLYERKLWSVMGTFTDYMIRKFLRDGLVAPHAQVTHETILTAELGLVRIENDDFLKESIAAIRDYARSSWESVIPQTFLMSQLDAIYRSGRLHRIHSLTMEEVNGIQKYLSNTLVWLKREFSDCTNIILNPVLGHPDVCAADADVIIDSTLYEIKTTKDPASTVRRNVEQLLGYVALAYYHNNRPTGQSAPAIDVDSIGYLLPQSLIAVKTGIESFTDSMKEEFCIRIIELRASQWDEVERKVLQKLENDEGTLVEWRELLEGLGRDRQFDRLVRLTKHLEESEERLTQWEPIFGDDYQDDAECLYYNVGVYLAQEGDPEYAEHCFNVFMTRSGISISDDPSLCLFLSLIKARKGEIDDARQYLEQALAKEDNLPKHVLECVKDLLDG